MSIAVKMVCGIAIFLLLVLSTSLVSFGQQAGPSKDQLAQLTAVDPTTLADGIPNDLSSQNSSNPAVSLDIEFQIVSKRTQIDTVTRFDNLIAAFVSNKENIKHAISSAKSIDNCDQDYSKLNPDYDNVLKSLQIYWTVNQDLQRAEGQTLPPFLGNFFNLQPVEKCKALKVAQQSDADQVFSQLEETAKIHKANIQVMETELTKLKERMQRILDSRGAIRVAENLPILILIIAGAAIAIICVVRLFTVELQMGVDPTVVSPAAKSIN